MVVDWCARDYGVHRFGQDSQQEIVVRLVGANGPPGYICVTASTTKQPGVDCAALTCERVAYKLLYRMTKPLAPAVEADGNAAFRQGVELLANCMVTGAGSGCGESQSLPFQSALQPAFCPRAAGV